MENASTDLLQSSRQRLLKDKLAHITVVASGLFVVLALVMIVVYLLSVVQPLFQSATTAPGYQSQKLSLAPTVMLGMDDAGNFGTRLTHDGVVEFYHRRGVHHARTVPLPKRTSISATAHNGSGTAALALSNGQFVLVKPDVERRYQGNVQQMLPLIRYPLGQQPLQLDPKGSAIQQLAVAANDKRITVVWQSSEYKWSLLQLIAKTDFASGELEWQQQVRPLPYVPSNAKEVLLTADQSQLVALNDHQVSIWPLHGDESAVPQLLQHGAGRVLKVGLLAGASSLLLADDNAQISQWFQVKDNGNWRYKKIRQFTLPQHTEVLATEPFRKVFASFGSDRQLVLFHTTSQQQLLQQAMDEPIVDMAFNSAGSALIVETADQVKIIDVDNPHPEISLHSLWQQVWYENYSKPEYLWQSSASSNDFESKLSVVPLVFGTIKAALFAMLFALPLAVGGAIYTAYFMSAKMRGLVKPTIELMEALPTVILGFIAGLWLAPLIEQNLAAMVLLGLLLPSVVIGAAMGWRYLPQAIQASNLLQYRELLLLPLLLLTVWFCFAISPWIELRLMGGDGRAFVTETLNISFDQRNALVVGMAMGFAVVPTIFTIAEDAIFSVPRHLVHGSLALGATQWQTLMRVVLVISSPGIFSAVMMGFGRAVGETMIVLMATGNTPVMEWNILEGMRTLAANIAIEMPESALGSSHYRVLFFTALLLFAFTFVFNTVAELVRQRLRQRYSDL